MILTVKGEAPEAVALVVTVNGEQKVISSTDPSITFEISKAGLYEITVSETEKMPSKRMKWWQWILFGWILAILAAVLYLILSILMLGGDSFDPIKSIRPYRLHAKWKIDMESDKEIRFCYSHVTYHQNVLLDRPPHFGLEETTDLQVNFLPNPKAFTDAIRDFIVGFFPLLFLLIAFFSFVLVNSILRADVFLILFSLFLLVTFSALGGFTTIHYFKKCKNMKHNFIKRHEK